MLFQIKYKGKRPKWYIKRKLKKLSRKKKIEYLMIDLDFPLHKIKEYLNEAANNKSN